MIPRTTGSPGDSHRSTTAIDCASRPGRGLWVALCGLGLILVLVGCTRDHYRKTADEQTYRILEEKAADPRWSQDNFDITPDSRSRFFDHNDPDHLYRNDGGVFTDVIRETFPHVAWFAMGSDIADLDGNGREDLFTLDMSGTDHFRQKTTMGAMSSRKWFLENANPRQYMRNALLMNEGEGLFREAAYLAGLADSDWGWSPKLEDFDEDGLIDAFITNGMSRNFTDSDHPMEQHQLIGRSEFEFYRHTGFKKDVNLAFRNEGGLQFLKISNEWGVAHEGMSFAAAHGDLDRDGDLDLVVVNLNEPAHLYRNESHEGNRVLVSLKLVHIFSLLP